MIGLRGKLGGMLTLAAVLPLLAATGLLWPMAREAVLVRGIDQIRADAERSARSLDARFAQVEASARKLARDVALGDFSEVQLLRLLETRALLDPDISAAQAAIAAGAEASVSTPWAHWVGRRGGQPKARDLQAMGYRFWLQEWFADALAAPAGRWTAPYFNDAAGGIDTVTFHLRIPFAHQPGVISLDLSLDRIDRMAAEVGVGVAGGGLSVLVDAEGRVLVHPDPALVRSSRIQRLTGAGVALAAAGARSGVFSARDDDGQRHYAALAELGQRGWRVGFSVAERDLLAPFERGLRRNLPWGLAGLLVLALAGALAAQRLARPIDRLVVAAERLAAGDFATPLVREHRRDALGRLQRAMERARQTAQRTLAELQASREHDQRVASELDVAHDIQTAMLPRDRVFLTDCRALTVVGELLPAKAVGGDFYHFFALDAGTLWFAIGDVSDKGVPSALFAARVGSLLAAHARQAATPGAMLQAAAAELYHSNDTGFFATVAIGVLRLDDGQLRLAAAGHEPPLRLRPGGECEWLAVEAGPALGFADDADYPEWCGTLFPDEQLLLYTDGVTEAMTRDHQEFGRERVEVALQRHEPRTPQRTCEALVAEVQRFVAGAEASDDLTLLVLGLTEREA